MLSTSLVVAGLSSGHKIGLAVVGGAFIIFALVSSFVLPRRDANWPGRGVGWYVLLGTLFVIAMLSAVIIFGREKRESAAAESTPPANTTTSSAPPSAPGPGGGQGDPTAGKAVFTSVGCSGCHTLKDAGSTGNVGPNLDQLKPPFARVKRQVENGGGPMPAFKDTLSAKQIDDVSAYVSSVAGK